jgi:hypothetical protein
MYGMTNVTIPGMRKTVRDSFRSYGSVKDYKVTDLLRHRGEQVRPRVLLASFCSIFSLLFSFGNILLLL